VQSIGNAAPLFQFKMMFLVHNRNSAPELLLTAAVGVVRVETHCMSPKNCNAAEGASRSPVVLPRTRG
jgi:hypothetical protein